SLVKGGLSYGTYYYPRLGDRCTGLGNDRRWDLVRRRSVQANRAGSAEILWRGDFAGLVDRVPARKTRRATADENRWCGRVGGWGCRVGGGAAVAFRVGSYSEARPLSEPSE